MCVNILSALVTIIFTAMFVSTLIRFVASLTSQHAASFPEDDPHVNHVKC